MHFILKDKLIIVKPSIGPNRPANYNKTFITILFSLTQSTIFSTSCSLLGLSMRVGQLTSMNIFILIVGTPITTNTNPNTTSDQIGLCPHLLLVM